ncbi:hypothetical protein M413DRAFT_190785 [Hebeloma cylindrosporum]|uniref:Uncharacterized protein n=1 Tax=Hebeloma cylindrosporum TaxID=76867 RepID=A0A0C2YEF4_HEBCY|nr:hypothetical protein M413DRAFT_190785 [Hebeloma cylindrosporum h7]
MPDSPRSSSSTPTTVGSPLPPNQLKRKEHPDDADAKAAPAFQGNPIPSGSNARPDEYESGCVVCGACGATVSIRDEETNKFTVKQWDAHRLLCPSAAQPAVEAVIYTPDNPTAETLAHPPSKRRRAKRTEEERIEYLRADPYVGQFEAYRVLCASCDKWIRLRPNSTYCSIPWDAHRKSCLAKKINNKNVYALEERNNLFSKDPNVRKFDPERLLCNMCDKWLSVPPDDHLQAVQKWIQHRASCQRTPGTSLNLMSQHTLESQQTPSDDAQAVTMVGSTIPRRESISSTSPTSPRAAQSQAHPPSQATPGPSSAHPPRFPMVMGSPSSFHDLNPSNYAPAHESRRRNAEQRAATLRADRLIGEVEPNRVFCSLCQKWVQLRQDSSYCAYPWLQHRGKCLARHQRRTQKAADVRDMKARREQHGHPSGAPHEEDELLSDREGGGAGDLASDELESEEGVGEGRAEPRQEHQQQRSPKNLKIGSNSEGLHHRRPSLHEDHYRSSGPSSKHHHHQHGHPRPHHHAPVHHHHGQHPPHHTQQHRPRPSPYGQPNPSATTVSSHHGHRYSTSSGSMSQAYRGGDPRSNPNSHGAPRTVGPRPQWDDDADADGEADAEGEYLEEEHSSPPPSRGSTNGTSMHRAGGGGAQRRAWPVGLADLDSPSGRKQFVFGSVEYLFATTYESTDEMSISALLAYVNAAMPQDKHEDFDTSEVARAVAAMTEAGRVVFEGDILRLTD